MGELKKLIWEPLTETVGEVHVIGGSSYSNFVSVVIIKSRWDDSCAAEAEPE
jgi:hypothetical protein